MSAPAPVQIKLARRKPKLSAAARIAAQQIDGFTLAKIRVAKLRAKYHRTDTLVARSAAAAAADASAASVTAAAASPAKRNGKAPQQADMPSEASLLNLLLGCLGGGRKPNGGKHPSCSGSGTTPAAGGELSLTDLQEMLWTGQVTVGTPGITRAVDFDTGSSDFFLNPGNYNPSASSTSTPANKNFTVLYGDGTTASGQVYYDTVTVAGVTATQQAVGNATQSTLADSGNSGILGCAFQAISQFQSPPLFLNLIQEGAVPGTMFCFGLWTQNARLDLGTIDTNAYLGNITYCNVDSSQGFWTVDSFSINGIPESGIIDTGTTLVIIPPADARNLFTAAGMTVSEQDGQVFGLYNPASPPKITFTFNGTPFTMSAEALSFQQQGNQMIASVIGADLGYGAPACIVGDSFMSDCYSVFDYGSNNNPRVGFAPRNPNVGAPGS